MKQYFLFLMVISLAAWGCRSGGGETAPQPAEIEAAAGDFVIVPGQTVGKISADKASETDIMQAYGPDAKKGTIYLVEGMEGEGIILFEGTKNQVDIYYDPEIAQNKPAFIRINQPGTDWKTDKGITLGTSIEELQRINGKPFMLSGFGWDYGGRVTDWQGGALDAGLMIQLEYAGDGEMPESILGEKTVPSDDPLLQGKVTVVSLEIRL